MNKMVKTLGIHLSGIYDASKHCNNYSNRIKQSFTKAFSISANVHSFLASSITLCSIKPRPVEQD